MKHTVSFSLEEETILKLRQALREGKKYRSKSHIVERAVERLLEDD